MAIYRDDPPKDPSDVLDYKSDFANTSNGGTVEDFLEAGEVITGVWVTAPPGLNVHDGTTTYDGEVRPPPTLTDNDTAVVFWLSGGEYPNNYTVTVKVTTSSTRVIERSRIIQVREL